MDGLEGACFILYEKIKDIHKGETVIFSGNPILGRKAENLGILYFEKPDGLNKLIDTYKKKE